jgi:hypothetical protein
LKIIQMAPVTHDGGHFVALPGEVGSLCRWPDEYADVALGVIGGLLSIDGRQNATDQIV